MQKDDRFFYNLHIEIKFMKWNVFSDELAGSDASENEYIQYVCTYVCIEWRYRSNHSRVDLFLVITFSTTYYFFNQILDVRGMYIDRPFQFLYISHPNHCAFLYSSINKKIDVLKTKKYLISYSKYNCEIFFIMYIKTNKTCEILVPDRNLWKSNSNVILFLWQTPK